MQPWVYEKLQEKGTTQVKIAKQLGIAPLSLSRKFSGKVPFLYGEVEQICHILDIQNPLDYKWGK